MAAVLDNKCLESICGVGIMAAQSMNIEVIMAEKLIRMGLCLAVFALAGCERVDRVGAARVGVVDDFAWPQGVRGAVSLTFDDARVSQIDRGMAILDSCGVRATFYVIPGSVERRLDGWKKAVETGHEIANHTLKHPCSGNFEWSRARALEDYTLDTMATEIDRANDEIARLLGVRPATFAYPCGQRFVGRGREVRSYVPLVAERFLVGRGAFDEAANDPGYCDLAQVSALSMDNMDFQTAKSLIDNARDEGRWIIFFGHEIGESGRQTVRANVLKAVCDYAKDPENGLWIDTVERVAAHVAGRRLVQ